MPTQSIPVELGGKTRNLRYDFNSLVIIEDVLGYPIAEIGQKFAGSQYRLRDVRALLWAGLLHETKALTQEQVGEWIELRDMAQLAEKIGEAFMAAFPDAGEPEKNG